MKKKLFLLAIVFGVCGKICAGGLLTNTNQNVSFLRNPARGASTEIDAAYTNPAGLAFLTHEGLSFSINNQSAFQTRTLTTTFAPFAGFGGNATKDFEGKATAWVIPSLQAAYKTGDWVFSGNFSVAGGGGTLEFASGLPSFESQVSMIPLKVNQSVGATAFDGYSLESRLKGSSITFGGQLGATYSILDNFSAYLGLRLNYVNNSYEGYLKNIQLRSANGGTYIPVQNIDPTLGDMNLDLKQTGMGIAPVIGLDYKWNNLNVGVVYEFKSAIELNNKTKENTTGQAQFDDGFKTPYDIPALLSVGAQYDILPALTVSAGYHHFFDSDAKMLNDRQKLINGGTNEYLAGVEYRFNPKFLASGGVQFTRSAVTDAFQSDLNYFLNSVSFGFGGAWNVTENIRINAAYFFTNYEDWTTETPVIATVKGSTVFGRTNKTFGIGVDFKF
ncbi:MAG: aromatic hydrocarbon degradation protein [Dysgonamonadaceae bacterium]|jgi:long-chain fatty acid transport protein|nr:aromatic hydrocarbon degradation protein [Dysgonamonadaceae bacterium]